MRDKTSLWNAETCMLKFHTKIYRNLVKIKYQPLQIAMLLNLDTGIQWNSQAQNKW